MAGKVVNVMLVDDSAVVRNVLTELLDGEPNVNVIATAQDPIAAARKLKKVLPDVMILDIEMPQMDGLTFLQKIMSQKPIPVIICSTLVGPGAKATLKALEYGAVGAIQKPKVGTQQFFRESKIELVDAINTAATANVKIIKDPMSLVEDKNTADVIIEPFCARKTGVQTEQIVTIGVSTGGTEALKAVLKRVPPDAPGILAVQHMPAGFTRTFAERLNEVCQINVCEAIDGQCVEAGHAYIAPGGRHMLVKRRGTRYTIDRMISPPRSKQ